MRPAAARNLSWILALASVGAAQAHHGGGAVGVGVGSPGSSNDTEGDVITVPVEVELGGGHAHEEGGEAHNEGESHEHGEESGGVEWHLSPMVYLGVNYQDRLVSLARADTGPVTLDASAAGYRLLQYRRLDWGAGAEVEMHTHGGAEGGVETVLGGFGVYMGLLPIRGHAVFADRFVPSKAAIPALPRLKLPYAPEDFARWTVADKMSFSQKGGVVFMGGVAYYGLSAGLAYLAQGEWTTLIEKVSSHAVRVRLGKNRLTSLSASASFGLPVAGVSFVSVGVNRFHQVDRNFSFEFDLRDAQAVRAYAAMLHGDLTAAQTLGENGSNGAVRKIDAGEATATGVTKYWKFGIPILITSSGTRGHVYSVADQQNFADGSRSTTNMGIFVNERRTRGMLSHHSFKASDFWATFQTRHLANGQTQQGHEAAFHWSFERDAMGDERLESALAGLEKLTGLHGKLMVDFPHANLGYARVQFDAHINGRATDDLMEAAQAAGTDGATGGRFGEVARAWVDRYFREGDAQGLCWGYFWYRNGTAAELNRQCQNDWTRKATRASVAMLRAMREMVATEDTDHAAFAAAYARFGRALLATPFTFKAVLVLAPIEMKFISEGERIPHAERTLAWRPAVH